jgi:histidine ammonia-lyase
MGLTAALKLRQVVDNVAYILGTELMAAAQGIDFRRAVIGADAQLGQGTAPVYRLIREQVPFIEQDTVLYEYLAAVKAMIVTGEMDKLLR